MLALKMPLAELASHQMVTSAASRATSMLRLSLAQCPKLRSSGHTRAQGAGKDPSVGTEIIVAWPLHVTIARPFGPSRALTACGATTRYHCSPHLPRAPHAERNTFARPSSGTQRASVPRAWSRPCVPATSHARSALLSTPAHGRTGTVASAAAGHTPQMTCLMSGALQRSALSSAGATRTVRAVPSKPAVVGAAVAAFLETPQALNPKP